jgi:alpha-tubulin suppressor-like RCC1 family protein
VVDIAARGLTRCARTRTGSVYCWGANDQGSVGDGTTLQRSSPTHVYTDDVVAVSGHGRATCAMRRTGAALCAGWNFGGMLGNGTNVDPQPTPTYVIGP